MNTKTVLLKYTSIAKFRHDYEYIRQGLLFLPSSQSLTAHTSLVIKLSLPGIGTVFTLNGQTIDHIEGDPTLQPGQKPGIMISLDAKHLDQLLKDFEQLFQQHEQYHTFLHTESDNSVSIPHPVASGLSLEWLQEAITAGDSIIEEEEELDCSSEKYPVEKLKPEQPKKLTVAERLSMKPIADFILNLTKAMLRSGYYEDDHPGSINAKQGLFDDLQKCMEDASEIMLTKVEKKDYIDINISGILDDPISIREMVEPGSAELFLPKLNDFFNRKSLISFAIKKKISLNHFNKFVDIMSNHSLERNGRHNTGEQFTMALTENNITEISTVFADDIIFIEENLPWRVEMAIQRLAKDMKILPMFTEGSQFEQFDLKLQIVKDIIRPMKHPGFLKDILVNCYIISRNVHSVNQDDLEKMIINSFSVEMIIDTSKYIFEELLLIQKELTKFPDNEILLRRTHEIKKLLKKITLRVVQEKPMGYKLFLEELYFFGIFPFEQLPGDVKYRVNTRIMAEDIVNFTPVYTNRIIKATDADQALTLLKCCKRVSMTCFKTGKWQTILELCRALHTAVNENPLYTSDKRFPAEPLKFVFEGLSDKLVAEYESLETASQHFFQEFTTLLGDFGINLLSTILFRSANKETRLTAVQCMCQQGSAARRWACKVLDDPKQEWYLYRNGLLILAHVGTKDNDLSRARKFLQRKTDKEEAAMVDAAIATLGKIGSDLSRTVLEKLAQQENYHASTAADAAGQITERLKVRDERGQETGQAVTS